MQVCLNVPSIVYSNSWLGQTAGIASTAIFTPSVDGQYRINVTIHGIANSGTGNVVISVTMNYYPNGGGDLFGPNLNLNPGSGNSENQIWQDVIVFGKSGSAISLVADVGYTGTATLNHYDLYVTIEQLQ